MILHGKIVNILGAGRSGRAAAALAVSHGAVVTLFDTAGPDSFKNLPEGVKSYPLANAAVGEKSSCDLLVISPGIDTFGEYVAAFSKNAGELIGETELGYRFYKGKIIAITGTNGKTTTTELIENIMNHDGISCVACGNYGVPLCEVVMMEKVPDSIALELSSFQLETISHLKAEVSIWLNFDADHMDRYSCIEDYKNAKLRIFENQTSEDVAIVKSGEDIGELAAQLISFTTEHSEADLRLEGDWIVFRNEKVLDLSLTRLRGLHNAENAMAAVAACIQLGISPEQIVAALKGFSPPLHRCELIRTLDGVEYLNDSKATNLHALDSALRSQTRPVVLIAGGKQKGLNYSPLVSRLKRHVQHAIVFGEIAAELEAVFSTAVKTQQVETLEQAVLTAQQISSHGDAVLLSPGTSSFDQFSGYEHRGDVFRDAVLRLR